MKPRIHVGPVNQVLHLDDEVLICDQNGRISSNLQQGYFIADTRLISGYRLRIGRSYPQLLNSSPVSENSGRFEFTNVKFVDDVGTIVPESSLHLRLDRVLGRGVHEDYELVNYSDTGLILVVEVSIESDFADIFDVKGNNLQRRGLVNSHWDAKKSILSNFFSNDGFERSVHFEAISSGDAPVYANGGLTFPLVLGPREKWSGCLIWRPRINGSDLQTTEVCHDVTNSANEESEIESWIDEVAQFHTSNAVVNAAVSQAVDDLIGLRMRLRISKVVPTSSSEVPYKDMWIPAAGVPWFVSIFGRDALITSMQAMHVSYKFAEASLTALSALQATDTDDERDMQPGKIQHELRRGELAQLGLIPHTPYYGTHDATPLFILTVAEAWKWHGDRSKIDRVRPNVEAALRWIDEFGDIDGDGLQEYSTRSKSGYFNQGWKDDGTAIVHEDGSLPKLPIATCENQAIVIAAKRAWADILDQAYGEVRLAQSFRDSAESLSDLLDEKFFWEEEGTYYLGLDGDKGPIKSVASNAGQLLYYNAVPAERAKLVSERLFADDMWSGWGIRTLSSDHPSYNPFSYQRGSVWPHDNVLIAEGLRNFGIDDKALEIVKAVFDASDCFVYQRMPELYAGLQRDRGSFPVQYLGANVPQAWAAGAVVQSISLMLGLKPKASDLILEISPHLPDWLESVTLKGLSVGQDRIDLRVDRIADGNYNFTYESTGSVKVVLI